MADSATIPGNPSPPQKRQHSLTSIQSVRLALAECLRDLKAGKIEHRVAGVLIYGYSKLAELLKEHALEDMQKRLEALEREPKGSPPPVLRRV